jgi:hypothetical protein
MPRARRGRDKVAEAVLAKAGVAATVGGVLGTLIVEMTGLGAAALAAVTAGATALLTAVPTAFLLQRRLSPPRRQRFSAGPEFTLWMESVQRELHVDLQGLTTRGEAPRVEDVFVDIRLRRMDSDPKGDGRSTSHPPEFRSVHSYLDRPSRVVLVITGGPGSGKTTLLRHTASQLLAESEDKKSRLPVLLNLRDHADRIKGRPELSLPEALRFAFDGPSSLEFLTRSLKHDRCVVMLDGLDEVDPIMRPSTADWINRQIIEHPDSDFIVTSRPNVDIHRTLKSHDALLRLEPFGQAQSRDFLHRWYRALEQDESFPRGTHSSAAAAAAELWSCVRVEPGLASLARSPLALVVIANIHRYNSPLPQSRADVYDELCKALLWRRQEAKGLEQRWTGEEIETPLRDLAYMMQTQRTNYLNFDEVRNRLSAWSLPSAQDPEDLLQTAVSSGVLVEPSPAEGLKFAHHAFQDYLTAVHIERTGHSEIINDAIDDGWWGETTWLYAQRADVNPIIRACLESGSVHATTLAIRCAQDTGYLEPDLRTQLERLTRPAALTTSPKRKALISGSSRPTYGLAVEVQRVTATEAPVVGAAERIEITARWNPAPATQARQVTELNVRLLLLAEDLDVQPATRKLRLDPDGAPIMSAFEVLPEREGHVELRIMVLDETSGFLLKECATGLDITVDDKVSLNP